MASEQLQITLLTRHAISCTYADAYAGVYADSYAHAYMGPYADPYAAPGLNDRKLGVYAYADANVDAYADAYAAAPSCEYSSLLICDFRMHVHRGCPHSLRCFNLCLPP
eukprot:15269822-Alexandrium_andersonii.AAC.1